MSSQSLKIKTRTTSRTETRRKARLPSDWKTCSPTDQTNRNTTPS